MKTVLKSDKNSYWMDIYAPLLEFCQNRGCVLYPDYSWKKPYLSSRGGGDQVELYGPVTLSIILEHFVLPDTAEISERHERLGRETYHFFDREEGVHFTFNVYTLEGIKQLLIDWENDAAQKLEAHETSNQVLEALKERFDRKPTEH